LVAKLDLRVDPDDKGVERILFPVFSYDGIFCGYTGRATTEAKPKVRDYFGLQKHNVLLGAHLIERKEINYVMLVEGPFDFARMVSYDVPAMATLHSSLTKNQAAILKQISKPVIVLLDNDKAGREGALVVKKLLDRHLPLLKCRYPHNKKDPDQLTKNEVYAMIKDARLL
jgi:DNA primase